VSNFYFFFHLPLVQIYFNFFTFKEEAIVQNTSNIAGSLSVKIETSKGKLWKYFYFYFKNWYHGLPAKNEKKIRSIIHGNNGAFQ